MWRRNRLLLLLVPLTGTCVLWATAGVLAVLTDQVAVGSNAFTTSASFCASPGGSTVTPAADTYVDQAAATTNYNTNTNLLVRSRSANRNARALIRFTLPTVPTNCTVSSATLQVYNATPSTGRTIDVYRAAAAWTTTTVNWNTQPATTGTAVGSLTTPAAGTQSWDVTAHVQAMYTTNNGFVLRDSAESFSATALQQTYRSVESATNKPQLVVNWS